MDTIFSPSHISLPLNIVYTCIVYTYLVYTYLVYTYLVYTCSIRD